MKRVTPVFVPIHVGFVPSPSLITFAPFSVCVVSFAQIWPRHDWLPSPYDVLHAHTA